MLVLLQLIKLIRSHSSIEVLKNVETRLSIAEDLSDIEWLIEDLEDVTGLCIDLTDSQYDSLYRVVRNKTYKAAFNLAS
jgi:hypothetical protein